MSLSSYYIYYPVRIGMETDLSRTLYNFQGEIAQSTGVAGRFLRKADDPWTWMEIYEDVRDVEAFDAALEQALERHGFNRFVEEGGHRHTERFVACA